MVFATSHCLTAKYSFNNAEPPGEEGGGGGTPYFSEQFVSACIRDAEPEPEPEPEPPQPAHFVQGLSRNRSRSRSRQKRRGSGFERDVKLSKINKLEMNE